jgi:ATP-dependent RNA helicase RhlE
VDILVATPGRLLDLMQQKHISLDKIRILILDEADRMLDMGFIHDIRKIISVLPVKRQTLFFSATMPPEIIKLSADILTDPVKVTVSPEKPAVETIQQSVYYVSRPDKKKLLLHILNDSGVSSALVFTRTKNGAEKLSRILKDARIQADSIHGDKSQNARQRALEKFKSRNTKVLVATDIASRGIDVERISHVINYDIPNESETYIHRIGRTGRAGLAGIAVSFCDEEERAYLKDINRLIKIPIPVVSEHPFKQGNIIKELRMDGSKKDNFQRPGKRSRDRWKKKQWKSRV